MSDFDQNRQIPDDSSRMVWSLAALSVGLFFCSVLAAKLVGDMVDSGMTRVAAAFEQATPARKLPWGVIDSAATGSIRAKEAPRAVAAWQGDAGK